MQEFSIAFSQDLGTDRAAAELGARAESDLGGPAAIAGGLLFSTAAAGAQGPEAGRLLAQRWPAAEIAGTSFEGLVGEGRVWRDEPCFGLLSWRGGETEPAVFAFEPEEQQVERIAEGILSAAGCSLLGPSDLVLLFPDAHGLPSIDGVLASLEECLGHPVLAGAAASGVDGAPPRVWASGRESIRGGLVGLVVPGSAESAAVAVSRVQAANGSRRATSWCEITASRSRWVDRLDDRPALEALRRELGFGIREPIEPHLDRLLVRVRRRKSRIPASTSLPPLALDDPVGDESFDEERYVIGLDERRGAFSLPVGVERGDGLALAWPDAALARAGLRESLARLGASRSLLQFSCRARDARLHGDPDLESAWVAAHCAGSRILGTVAPFQIGPGPRGAAPTRLLVHATVLAALGSE